MRKKYKAKCAFDRKARSKLWRVKITEFNISSKNWFKKNSRYSQNLGIIDSLLPIRTGVLGMKNGKPSRMFVKKSIDLRLKI